MRRFRNFFISLCILILFTLGFNFYLSSKIDRYYNKYVRGLYANGVKDKGVILEDYGFKKDDLMILGSSELGVEVPQNPKKLFPISDFKRGANVIGKGYVQGLEHSLNLGGINSNLKNKKVVYVVSLQWFSGKDIKLDGFNSNFSELKFYKYLNNKKISEENKLYVASRVNNLLKNQGELKYAKFYANLYSSQKLKHKLVKPLLKPYYYLRMNFLELKDKYNAYELLKSTRDKNKGEIVKDINWEKEYENAINKSKKECTNNSFYVNDEYYEKYLKSRIKDIKGNLKDLNLLDSNEYGDYTNFLSTCKQLNLEPLIVLMPVNGYYYDYLGLSKEKRIEFYNKVEEMAKGYGFKVLNLKDKDYEPYYMTDVMHLGRKGWLNISEEITKHFK